MPGRSMGHTVGILFRSSRSRFTVFGACTYDSVSMIAGSYCGFLPNAGHVRTAYKDLREASWEQSASLTISFQ